MLTHNVKIKKWVRCLKSHREERTEICHGCPNFEGEHASFIECSYSTKRGPAKCPICKKDLYCDECSIDMKGGN